MREEARAHQHRREEIADEIAYMEMPGVPRGPEVTARRDIELDRAYWKGVRKTAALFISRGATPERAAQVLSQADGQLRKLERHEEAIDSALQCDDPDFRAG